MSKFGEIICKYRKIIIILTLILLIPALIGMKATRINYDILVYLPEDIETIEGEKHFIRWINMGGFSIVILDNMKSKEIRKFSKRNQKIR